MHPWHLRLSFIFSISNISLLPSVLLRARLFFWKSNSSKVISFSFYVFSFFIRCFFICRFLFHLYRSYRLKSALDRDWCDTRDLKLIYDNNWYNFQCWKHLGTEIFIWICICTKSWKKDKADLAIFWFWWLWLLKWLSVKPMF
jgi:hypothetical protein